MRRYVFCFTLPHFIVADENTATWQPVSFTRDGIKLLVFRPFLASDDYPGSSPKLKFSNVPSVKQTHQSKNFVLGDFIALPNVADEGSKFDPTMHVCMQDKGDKIPSQYVNGLRIDAFGVSQEKANRVVREAFSIALVFLRRRTRQFWIGELPSYFSDTLKCEFEIRKDGSMVNWPAIRTKSTSLNESVIPASYKIWTKAWKSKIDPNSLSAVDYYLDAQHENFSGKLGKATVSLALSIERAKNELWMYLLENGHCDKQTAKKAINDSNKPYQYLESELKNVWGKAFSDINKNSERLKSIWIARGIIAHAKEHEMNKVVSGGLDRKLVNECG